MPSKKHQSTIESNNAFMVKMEDLVKEIIIQSNIPYYRIESRMDHHANSDSNNYLPIVRVITYFEDSVTKISEIICAEFDVANERSKDKKKVRLDSFSYKHIQFMASLKPARQELIEYRRSGNKKFEIQVCSMLQDAWAGIEKELGYDNSTFPEEMKRDFYRVGALLEMADLEFLKIRSQLSSKYGWVEQALSLQNEEEDFETEEKPMPAALPQQLVANYPKPEPQQVQPIINNYIPEVVVPAPQHQPQPVYVPQPQYAPQPFPVQQIPLPPVPVQVQPVMNVPPQYMQQPMQQMPQPIPAPPFQPQQYTQQYTQQYAQPIQVQPVAPPVLVQPIAPPITAQQFAQPVSYPAQEAYVPQQQPAPVVLPVQNIMPVVEAVKATVEQQAVNLSNGAQAYVQAQPQPQPQQQEAPAPASNGVHEYKMPEVVNIMPLNMPVTQVQDAVTNYVQENIQPRVQPTPHTESTHSYASAPAPQPAAAAPAPVDDESIPFYEREPKPVKTNVLDENAQMTDATLKQYVANSKLVKEVDSEVARRAGATLNNDVDIEGDVERLKYLKVYSLKQLHERIQDNKNDIIAFAEKWIGKDNGGSFDSGICLFYLEYLLVGKKNDPAFAVEYVLKFISDNDYSARFIIPTYNSISKSDQPIASHLTLK